MATNGQRAVPLAMCIPFVFISCLASEPGSTTAATAGPQAEINNEVQAAHRAGTTAAMNDDFKAAESCSSGISM